jgi:hypothetical protein
VVKKLIIFFPTMKPTTLAAGYIFTLKEGQPAHVLEHAIQKAKDLGGEVTHKYDLVPGFAVKFPQVMALEVFEQEFPFADVEKDGEVHTLNG